MERHIKIGIDSLKQLINGGSTMRHLEVLTQTYEFIEVNNLKIDFIAEAETITAVNNNITFTVNRNEIVGIAGESELRKISYCLAILQLLSTPPAKYLSGEILFSPDGIQQINLIGTDKNKLREIRGGKIGMIFQEPMTSLNPVFTCGDQVMEANTIA